MILELEYVKIFYIDLDVSIRVYRFMGMNFEIYLILSHFRILAPTI
jgi:hypothetical protein